MASAKADSFWFAAAIVIFGVWWFWFRDVGAGDMLTQLAKAIQAHEGGNPDPQVAATNPGNLKPPSGKPNFWTGQIGVNGAGFAIFDSFTSGFNALLHDLTVKINAHPDWTLQNLFNRWLGSPDGIQPPPAAEGNAVAYAKDVARRIGAAVTTTLGNLLKGNF